MNLAHLLNSPTFDVSNPETRMKILQQRVIIVNSAMTERVCVEIIADMLYLESEDPTLPIHLLVDSPGGLIAGGLAIIDTIDGISPPVFTYCYGIASALAAIIVAHGTKPYRYAATSSKFFICEPSIPNRDSVDISNEVYEAELLRTTLTLAQSIANDTGHSLEKVRKDLAAPTPFDAIGAQAYNLVDHVVDKYPECALGI